MARPLETAYKPFKQEASESLIQSGFPADTTSKIEIYSFAVLGEGNPAFFAEPIE